MDCVVVKCYKFTTRREFSQGMKWKAPTTAGCISEMGFLSGKTACFVGNVAVGKHRTRQLGKLGVGGCRRCLGVRGGRGSCRSNSVRYYCSWHIAVHTSIHCRRRVSADGRTGSQRSLPTWPNFVTLFLFIY